MIISHKFKFIFIKTVKTAGTSMEVFLAGHCGADDIVTPVYPREQGHQPRNHSGRFNPVRELTAAHADKPGFPSRLSILRQALAGRKFFNHIPAVSVRARIPQRIWRTYFKFCVERNPFEKTLSLYHMHKKQGIVGDIEAFMSRGDFPRDWNRYSDYASGPIVDHIIDYKDLNSGLGEICQQLGIPYSGSLSANAKAGYRSDKLHYSQVFTQTHRQRLEEVFARELKYFGYRWDGFSS